MSSVRGNAASADFEYTESFDADSGHLFHGWHVANVQDFYDMLCAAVRSQGRDAESASAMIGKWSSPDVAFG